MWGLCLGWVAGLEVKPLFLSKSAAKVGQSETYFPSKAFLGWIQNNRWDFFCPGLGFLHFSVLPLHPLLKELDSVAQLVEHLTFNQVVMGSNPIGITF